MQVLDREAVNDLRDLYRDRERFASASRQPDLAVNGRRSVSLAVTEREIARYEATMMPAEIEEARRA